MRPEQQPHGEQPPQLNVDTMLAIKKLIADPIAEANERANREMKQLLADHVVHHDNRLKDHENRIASLEQVKRRALMVWTMIVMGTTFAAKAVWDGYLKPFFFPGKQ